MTNITSQERGTLEAFSRLAYANPFLPERIAHERTILGEAFVESDAVWSLLSADPEADSPNLQQLAPRAEALAEALRGRMEHGSRASEEERELYEDLVLYTMYERFREPFHNLIVRAHERKLSRERVAFYDDFVRGAERFLDASFPVRARLPHLFACLFQIRRAFHHIFTEIVGRSMPAARLRAAVWQSIFTHDLRRYWRTLYRTMGDMTTLITGPSGTGKELVARAIAFSRYIAFDPKGGTFTEDFAGSFYPISISSLSPTIVESELFGHRRGSFTGAVADRAGWLEVCPPLGTVFLDEIGDVDPHIQVKLLRTLQTRTLHRLGETQTRRFHGKIMAATNRDLALEMDAGRFRKDFYYRLCSDLIVTPSLREQLADSPEDLENLLLFITTRIAEDDAAPLAEAAEDWIRRHLGDDYAWPGNFRELEQCVRNVLIRQEYRPLQSPSRSPHEDLAAAIAAGSLTADELLNRYCTLVHAQAGSYEEAARRLGLDRRTVKSRVTSPNPRSADRRSGRPPRSGGR